MKNEVRNFKNYFLYLGMFFLVFGLNSCSSDDDGVIPTPTGTLQVEDQTASQNQIVVDQVTLSTNGYLIARHNTQAGTILAQENITSGTQNDMVLQLDDQGAGVDLQDGDTIVLHLYADNGDGTYNPTTDTLVATESITISSPQMSIADQPVVDNTVTLDNVSTSQDSFVVAFGENEDGTINENDVLGTATVQPGETNDLPLTFAEGAAPAAGTFFQTRLHRDVNRDQIFDPVTDTPEFFGFDTNNRVLARTQVTQ